MKRSYYTKLTGVSFRQKEVSQLKPGKTPLRVLAIDDNEYDQYACEVQALLGDGWTQIGWIAKGSNKEIHDYLKSGGVVNIECKDVTGEDKKTLGVNVAIEYGEDDSVELSALEKQPVDFGDTDFVYFDPSSHRTYDPEGRLLQSGSETEKKYRPPVDLSYAAKAIGKRTGLRVDDITSVWDAKAEMSQLYGTALHRAIELRLLYLDVMDELDEYKKRDKGAENWMPACFGNAVSQLEDLIHTKRYTGYKQHTEARLKFGNLTGIADLILMNPDGEFRLVDFKTNIEIKDIKYQFGNKKEYTVQQNHYRTILEKLGYKCLSMELFHWNGDAWEIIPLDRIDLEQEITWTE